MATSNENGTVEEAGEEEALALSTPANYENGKAEEEKLPLHLLLPQMFPAGKPKSDQLPWQWDWECGKRLGPNLVKSHEDGFCVQFHPSYALGTVAIRGKLRLDEFTVAYWEVVVAEVYGSSMMFGIGTENTLLHTQFIWSNLLGGVSSPGGNEWHSCGLSHKGQFYYGGTASSTICASFEEGQSCRVGVLFDGPSARIGFSLNGQWLGWASQRLEQLANVQGSIFYPMVASTAQHSRFSLVRLSQRVRRIYVSRPLQYFCKNAIIRQLMDNNKKMTDNECILTEIDQLGLSRPLAHSLEEFCQKRLLLRKFINNNDSSTADEKINGKVKSGRRKRKMPHSTRAMPKAGTNSSAILTPETC